MLRLLPLLCLLTPPGPAVLEPPGAIVVREAFLMGTTLRAEVAANERTAALTAIQAAFDTVARLEALLSTWRNDSEIARLNGAAPGDTVVLSPALGRLLDEAACWSRATGGAFDPAVGALTDAWDLRRGGRVPSGAALAEARAATGLAQFWFARGDSSTHAARRSAGAWLDTGGFGKGAALRAAVTVLIRSGAQSGMLNFGGQVVVFGNGPDGAAWRIPVADPRRRGRPVGVLQVSDASVSTSAQSERFVDVDGRRFGHILDPRTGRPVPAWGSVTVVAADPVAADILSTALFVLGPEDGAVWARQHDVAALFLVGRGGRLEFRPTPPLHRFLPSPFPLPQGG